MPTTLELRRKNPDGPRLTERRLVGAETIKTALCRTWKTQKADHGQRLSGGDPPTHEHAERFRGALDYLDKVRAALITAGLATKEDFGGE